MHGRKHSYCRRCHAAYMRAHRPAWSSLSTEQRRRSLARSYARTYMLRGHLKRGPCADCGATEGVQMHHEDYSRPLDVTWLCVAHHRVRHARA